MGGSGRDMLEGPSWWLLEMDISRVVKLRGDGSGMNTGSNVGFILPSEGEIGHGGLIGSAVCRAQCMNGCRLSFRS